MRILPLGLFGLKNGGLYDNLKDKAVVLAVEGSRHFRQPAQLGVMKYEGCEILVLGPAVTLDQDAFMRNATGSAVRFEESAGVKIAVFDEKQEEDVWTTYVSFPKRGIVLIGTSGDYLGEVLARMSGASASKAWAETLPEWKYVNVLAPVWEVVPRLVEG